MKNGFLLIDKEKGISSFKLVIILRKLLQQKRIGFAGTLDPLASGLMILAVGEYTKLLNFLEIKDKHYQVEIEFGKISDSYDAEGNITNFNVEGKPSLKDVEQVLDSSFLGKILQKPPIFSAIQIDGKRAYDLARKGENFELKAREVEIFALEIVEYEFPKLVLNVHCSSGTYIRSLANDLGEKLKVGGYVKELRRTKIADISVENAVKSEQLNLQDLKFLDAKELLSDLPVIDLNADQYQILAKGNFIDAEFLMNAVDEFSLAYFENQTVGVIERVKKEQLKVDDGKEKLKFLKKFNIVDLK